MIGDGPLVQVAQRAVDLERAAAFYVHLLGVPVAATFDPPGLAFLVLGETRLLLERGAPSALPYFAVDDLPKALERVEALGGSIVHPGESWAICKDSEGSPFGLAG